MTNDNLGTHTCIKGGGILWKSNNPLQFKLSDAEIGFKQTKDYIKNVDLNKATKLYGADFKFERPGILFIKGKPSYFYGPSGFNLEGQDHTVSYVMKIKSFK